jgi:hypothetical protein
VSGRFRNLKPNTQPTVQLLSGEEDLGVHRSSIDIAAGNFEIHDVLDGSYRLRVIGVGPENEPLAAERRLEVKGGDVQDLDITMRPGATVAGTVRIDGPATEDDKQAATVFQMRLEASESIRALGVDGFYSRTPEDGAFQVSPVIPGSYRVVLEAPPGPLYVASARAGNQDLLAAPTLSVHDGAPPRIDVVLRTDGGSLRGTAPAGPACILIVPESANRPPAGDCIVGGEFIFTGLAPGSYRLHAWKGRVEADTAGAIGMRVEILPDGITEVRIPTLSEAPKWAK